MLIMGSNSQVALQLTERLSRPSVDDHPSRARAGQHCSEPDAQALGPAALAHIILLGVRLLNTTIRGHISRESTGHAWSRPVVLAAVLFRRCSCVRSPMGLGGNPMTRIKRSATDMRQVNRHPAFSILAARGPSWLGWAKGYAHWPRSLKMVVKGLPLPSVFSFGLSAPPLNKLDIPFDYQRVYREADEIVLIGSVAPFQSHCSR